MDPKLKILPIPTTAGDGDKTTTTITTTQSANDNIPNNVRVEEENDDDNESYFEIELTFPTKSSLPKTTTIPPRNDAVFRRTDTDSDAGCSKRASTTSTSSDDSSSSSSSFYRDIRRFASPDVRLSTEKLPPRSPTSILRTPTTLRSLILRDSRRVNFSNSNRSESLSETSVFAPSPSRSWTRRGGFGGGRFFSLRFKIDNVSNLRRSNSSGSVERRSVDDTSSTSSSSRRIMRFLKPLYHLRVSHSKEKVREEFDSSPATAVAAVATGAIGSPGRGMWMWSPMNNVPKSKELGGRSNSRFGVKAERSLGKSRSTTSLYTTGSGCSPANMPVPVSRRDDSMVQHKDGIESAILHCKQSLNSCSGMSCSLSRCTSDSSNGKSLQRL